MKTTSIFKLASSECFILIDFYSFPHCFLLQSLDVFKAAFLEVLNNCLMIFFPLPARFFVCFKKRKFQSCGDFIALYFGLNPLVADFRVTFSF